MSVKMTVSVAALAAAVLATNANAAETIRLSVGASHPETFLPVGVMVDTWMPRVNELLAEHGGEYEIDWSVSVGGSLYGIRETRSAVADGFVDVGWVGTLWESSAMPLSSVAYFTWFAASDPMITHAAFNQLVETSPELQNEWTQQGLVFLGASGGDSYHLFTKTPVRTISDVTGLKISTPGVAANGLRGSGAVAVDSAITNFYTDVQTGLTDGAFSFYTGIYPTRLYEVAKYVVEIDAGSIIFGGLAMNKARFDGLPEPVRQAIETAGREYSVELAERTASASEAYKQRMIESGVEIVEPDEEFRSAWVNNMPDMATDWIAAQEAKGLAGRAVLDAYMSILRDLGATPARNWGEQ